MHGTSWQEADGRGLRLVTEAVVGGPGVSMAVKVVVEII